MLDVPDETNTAPFAVALFVSLQVGLFVPVDHVVALDADGRELLPAGPTHSWEVIVHKGEPTHWRAHYTCRSLLGWFLSGPDRREDTKRKTVRAELHAESRFKSDMFSITMSLLCTFSLGPKVRMRLFVPYIVGGWVGLHMAGDIFVFIHSIQIINRR